MPVEREFSLGRLRLRTMLLLGAILAVLMMGAMGSTQLTAKADAACSGGAWCPFAGNHLLGTQWGNYNCQVAFGVNFPESFSARNNCGNNVRMGWNEAGFVNWKFCMSPGDARVTPGRINYAGPC
jgi:hypothetical protein